MKKRLFILLFTLIISSVFAQEHIDNRFSTPNEDNSLQPTEYNRIFVIKPSISHKSSLELNYQYTIRIFDKNTNKLVVEFNNVVENWVGISGWNGRVVEGDYAFITSDYKQYIVKANRYYIEVINDDNNVSTSTSKQSAEIDIETLKKENVILKLILIVLAVLVLVFVIINKVLRAKSKALLNHKQILKIQEDEKAKISREIHDTIVQDIRAIRLETDLITTDDMEHKNRVIEDITKCIIKMRNICYNLTPAELVSHEDGDSSQIELISIIDTLCQQFSVKTKIVCSLQIDKNLEYPSFSKEVSTNVVRVFQEILTNIEKHSYATKTTVLVRSKEENNQKYLLIFVIDDGIGCEIDEFKSKKLKKHFGIRNMQERMHEIDGGIEFFSAPDEGMKVVLTIKA